MPECHLLPVKLIRAKQICSRATGCAHVLSLLHLQAASESFPWHSWLQIVGRSWVWVSLGSPVSWHRRSWLQIEDWSWVWVSLGSPVSRHRTCISGRSLTEMTLCFPQTAAPSRGLDSPWPCVGRGISQASHCQVILCPFVMSEILRGDTLRL